MKNSRSTFPPLLRLLAVTLAAVGCGDVFPDQIDGTFELTRVDGGPLPYTLWEAAGERAVLVAAELAFHPDGSVIRQTTFRFREGAQERVEVNDMPMDYRLNGRRLEVGWFTPCPPNAMCLANDVGVAEPDRVLLSSTSYGGSSGAILLEFRRR